MEETNSHLPCFQMMMMVIGSNICLILRNLKKQLKRGYPWLPNGDVICGRILYLQGLVYCSLDVSLIATFNFALKQWKILPYSHIGYEHFIYSDYLIDSGSGRDSNNSLLIGQSRVLFQDPYSS